MEKQYHYAALIQSQIFAMFQEESENYVDKNELLESENFMAFMHALASIVPCNLFNRIAKDEKDVLEFNHIANALIFQFSKLEEEAK